MAGHALPRLQIGEWVADPNIDTLSRAGTIHKLEPRTMRLLMLLAHSPGSVFSVEQMLSELWSGVVVGPASVYQAISQLRRLLQDTEPEPTYIATVPRKGYRLIAAVSAATPEVAAEIGSADSPSAPIAPNAEERSARLTDPGEQPARGRRPRRWLWQGGLALLILALIGYLPLRRYLLAPPAWPSIVVLPFLDLTPDKSNQAFCDGLTEELSNWLAQIPTLRVVARTSAFAYRDRGIDVRTIGKQLGTSEVLEGSLRRTGDQIRITAQLVSTRDGYHLWSANFDRPIDDVVKVQEEIARSVAENLEIRLTEQSGQGFAARRNGTPQAYQLYLLARHHQQQLTRDSNDRAIELYQQALALDPNFALAYAGLAFAYVSQLYLDGLSANEVAAKAEPLLERGIRLDPQLPDLYTARGALRTNQDRYEEALNDLQHATELNPSDSQALGDMGYLYSTSAQPRDALARYDAAATLDPLNFNFQARRCIALADMARFDEADLACARARALAPNDTSWAYTASCWFEWTRGRLEQALYWNALAIKNSPNEFTLYKDRSALLLSLGRLADAREQLQNGRAFATSDDLVAVRLAQIDYYESGVAALRARLQAANHFADSPHADTLILAANEELLLGDAQRAEQLLTKTLSAPDLDRSTLDDPWVERQGDSADLSAGMAELARGEQAAATQRLDALEVRLEQLLKGGEERGGVYKLRAAVLALKGDADGAMSALRRAVDLGWRSALETEHDPAFASLQSRADFRALMTRIGAELQSTQRPDSANSDH